ncbi:MAG: 2-phospho-L-lactate transferase [Acidobacteria bacterium]|nr:2-phospho-L-lactate transferase [Acidobacteriota bacterium]
MITVLSGGTGGAKFVQGLSRVVPAEDITVIVNTGDDLEWWGLHVSPDLDSISYALAGQLSRERGWGVEGDSFHCAEAAARLGLPTWFRLGDRDLALHLARTQLLGSGRSLGEATAEIVARFGVRSSVLPMTNQRVETRVSTAAGELNFQEYFVREHYAPTPLGVCFAGAEQASPAPGVLEALAAAQAILIAPSNPITSIGPILAIPGIRHALRAAPAPIAAVSPMVGGAAVSGPAAALMRAAGFAPSYSGVASAYSDFLDVLIADYRDAKWHDQNAALGFSTGVRVHFCDTIMTSEPSKDELARAALSSLGGALDKFCSREAVSP